MMATHLHSALAQMIFGSVASRVVGSGVKPVLMVRPKELKGKAQHAARSARGETVSSPYGEPRPAQSRGQAAKSASLGRTTRSKSSYFKWIVSSCVPALKTRVSVPARCRSTKVSRS